MSMPSKFHVGQRVRVKRTGHLATIWQIGFQGRGYWNPENVRAGMCEPYDQPHCIDVDGIGRVHPDSTTGALIAMPARELEPLFEGPEMQSADEWRAEPKVVPV